MSTSDEEEIFTIWADDSGKYDASVIYLCGELDASTVPSFLAEVTKILDRSRNAILDVHLLSYIDSTGLAAMLSIKNTLQRDGKDLYLAGSHGVLAKILQITHVDKDIECFEDLESAARNLTTKQGQI